MEAVNDEIVGAMNNVQNDEVTLSTDYETPQEKETKINPAKNIVTELMPEDHEELKDDHVFHMPDDINQGYQPPKFSSYDRLPETELYGIFSIMKKFHIDGNLYSDDDEEVDEDEDWLERC